MDDKHFGATFVADLFAVLLLGVSTVQTAVFFKTSNEKIPYLNKLAITLLWALNILHVAITSHVTYYYLITVQGNVLVPMVWSYTGSAVLELFVTNVTQILYSVRLWQVLRPGVHRTILFIVVVALILFSLAMNIYVPLQVSTIENIVSLGNLQFWAVALDFCVSSAIDFLLAISLIHGLGKLGKKFDWANTSVEILVAYALNTGIIAGLFSLSCIIAYILMPDNLIFFSLKIVLTGLYVNSFLAMINSRFYFQRSEGLVSVALPHGGNLIMYDRGGHGHGPTRATRTMQAEATNNVTINEVGLPLFKPRHASSELSSSGMQLLEVKVTKEERQTHGV